MDVPGALVHRLFYPQVPAVMSAQRRGRVSAMPVVSYASISDSPPLLAVSCNPDGFTCKLAVGAKAFSLSVMPRSLMSSVERLAQVRGADVKDKLESVGLAHGSGTVLPVPVIEGAEAVLECQLRSNRQEGDHVLLVGLVKAAHASDAFSEFWDFSIYSPILYAGWRGGLTTYPPDKLRPGALRGRRAGRGRSRPSTG